MNYQLEFPGRVIFGPGTLGSVFEHLPPSRVLVVAGSHCADAFRTAFPDKKFELITGVRAEPTLDDVERVRRAAARYGATAIIGIGGGSVLDTAKATAALLDETRPTADFFYGAATAKPRCVFLALLPTTAGTGAEITGNAVLTDEKTGVKQSLRTLGMRADVALIDPELTYDCPASIAAASGFDALTQAIESFLSRRANAASSPLAAEAVRKIFPALRAAVRGDRAARNHVAEGSMLAALAFAQSGLGGCTASRTRRGRCGIFRTAFAVRFFFLWFCVTTRRRMRRNWNTLAANSPSTAQPNGSRSWSSCVPTSAFRPDSRGRQSAPMWILS